MWFCERCATTESQANIRMRGPRANVCPLRECVRACRGNTKHLATTQPTAKRVARAVHTRAGRPIERLDGRDIIRPPHGIHTSYAAARSY